MLSRILFLLLLAANLGVAAWIALTPSGTVDARAGVGTDPGVAPLVLLSEREGEGDAAELAEAPRTESDRGRDRCIAIGPFPTQSDVRRAINLLTPSVQRIQQREAQAQQSRGWLVYLPAPATREEALAVARQLYGRGVRDYYVVTAGQAQNTISLGLFKDRNNAERRRAEIALLGFTPAITERTEQLPVYWVDLALGPDDTLAWREKMPDMLDVGERVIQCF